MQKIMFEHRRFGLEQAVIARLKENTRRRVRFPEGIDDEDVESAVMGIDQKGRVYFTFSVATDQGTETVDVYPKYQIGERVAIAQSYENIPMEHFMEGIDNPMKRYFQEQLVKQAAAYKNKLFAVASLMPHVIEITDIKAERLQDISNEDCRKEGIIPVTWRQWHRQDWDDFSPQQYTDHDVWTLPKFREGLEDSWADSDPDEYMAASPKTAFAVLIIKLQGRKAWERNEWQFAYTFKLIK